MKLKAVYILPGLFGMAFISLVLVGNLGPSEACFDAKQFKESQFNSIVKHKYIDSTNHDFKTVLSTSKGITYSMILVDDTSGYYEYIQAGDIISKSKNSDYILVNGKKPFHIYFRCK